MAIIQHLKVLHEKHAELDAALEEQYTRPVPNEELVKDLKIKKLRIKDEISRFQTDEATQ